MKRRICFFVGLALFCCTKLMAQQYTAVNYWKMEHDSVYIVLNQRQNSGVSLSIQEQSFMAEYKTKLSKFFERMSDNEKSLYYKNRTKWAEQPMTASATQIMYKCCFYKESRFDVYEHGRTYDQTESKFSHIIGLGYIIGRQFDIGRFVLDDYCGAGLRLRIMSINILSKNYPPSFYSSPNEVITKASVYPFVNFGLRIGIKLQVS